MFCMVHYGDDASNPLRERIASDFPTLSTRYPSQMTFVWVQGKERMMRVGVLPGDFHNGTLPQRVLCDIVWRVERMSVHV